MRRNIAVPTAWTIAAIIFTIWSFSSYAQQMFAPEKIDNKHESAKECSDCHQAFKGTPDVKCLTCHKDVLQEQKRRRTIHAKTSKACDFCHGLHEKKLVSSKNFHSTDTFFKGKHVTTKCFNCHKEGEFINTGYKNIPRTCNICHSIQKHKTSVSNICEKCHKMPTWKTFIVQHKKGSNCTSCHLKPKFHSIKQCPDCHTVKNWKTQYHDNKQTCVQCHKKKTGHYSDNCKLCHTKSSWKEDIFSHPFVEGHYDIDSFKCTDCHPRKYKESLCSCHGFKTYQNYLNGGQY